MSVVRTGGVVELENDCIGILLMARYFLVLSFSERRSRTSGRLSPTDRGPVAEDQLHRTSCRGPVAEDQLQRTRAWPGLQSRKVCLFCCEMSERNRIGEGAGRGRGRGGNH